MRDASVSSDITLFYLPNVHVRSARELYVAYRQLSLYLSFSVSTLHDFSSAKLDTSRVAAARRKRAVSICRRRMRVERVKRSPREPTATRK